MTKTNNMPYFSIVMQSTLKDYPGAASNRTEKLVRAIESIVNQTFEDWKLIIVADNCFETGKIVKEKYNKEKRIVCIHIVNSNPSWSAAGRNVGKTSENGNYILYLDNDDYYSPDYLLNLKSLIESNPATWFIVDNYELKNETWQIIRARLLPNSAGTANVVHSSEMKSRWPDSGIRGSEDWQFIKRLMNESKDYKHLDIAGYYIAHINGRYDV